MIQSYQAAAWRQAMDLMQGMQRRRVRSNVVIYNSALRLGDSGNVGSDLMLQT